MPSSSSRNRAAAPADDNGVKVVVIETRYVRTDAEHFKSVVQSLTGKDSTLHAVVPEKPSPVASRWPSPPVPESHQVLHRPPAHNLLVEATAGMAASAEESELEMWLHGAAVGTTNALQMLETLPHQTYLHPFGSWQRYV